MIFEIFHLLSEQLNRFFVERGLDDSEVILDNIAVVDGPTDVSEGMRDKVVMTLVNFQEEATLKNFPNHLQTPQQVIYRNSIVNIHLFVLFTANRNNYHKSLKDLSVILEFFQGKRLFTQANTVFDREVASMGELGDFRFTVELFSPTFEELNFLWGTLGGRQLPAALYKLCIVPITSGKVTQTGPLVEQINNEFKHK
nr:DUF4255 domain-containing protein [Cytophagales bacterium]